MSLKIIKIKPSAKNTDKNVDRSAYYLIAKQPNGQKIGFIVDEPGK